MTQDHLFFVLNGRPLTVAGEAAFQSLAEFVRRELAQTGTKIACGQGACGACTMLIGKPCDGSVSYVPVNSCIQRVFQVHGCHVVTVEGLHGPNPPREPELNPIQQAMYEHHGAQCGFCTPGMVMALTSGGESSPPQSRCEIQAALCGNLCRCTGYTAILEAAENIDWSRHRKLSEFYPEGPLVEMLSQVKAAEVAFPASSGGQHLAFVPATLCEALNWRAHHPESHIIAGGTEFGEVEEPRETPLHWLHLGCIPALCEVDVMDESIVMGATASWNIVHDAVREALPEFAALLDKWGSQQLRNAGTVGGSVMKGSAVSDCMPLFLVCDAEVQLQGPMGMRRFSLRDFQRSGNELKPGELLTRVWLPIPAYEGAQVQLHKVSRRAAFDRSVVNAAFWWRPSGEEVEIRLAFGGAGDRVLRLEETEAFLNSYSALELREEIIWRQAVEIAKTEINPPTDASGGSNYRRHLVGNLLLRFGQEFFVGEVASFQL